MASKKVVNKYLPEPQNWFISNRKILILIFVSFVMILFLLIVIVNFERNKESSIKSCLDGTFYSECSLRKPYYCDSNILIEKASICGCPTNLEKKGDSCFSIYQTDPKNITLKYVLRGDENYFDFLVYKGLADYLFELPKYINYNEDETSFRRDFKIRNIDEEVQREFLLPLVTEIQNVAETDEDAVRIAISLVQNIPYNDSGDFFVFALGKVNYSKYPYEVLYSEEAICEEKVGLLAFLLREMDYGVALFYYPEENHEALGIKCPIKYSLMNSGYCFIETTGPSILSNSEEYYIDEGIITKLDSEPQIILLAEGKSLDGMYEYWDANKIIKINSLIEEKGKLNYFLHKRLENLKTKYGLNGMYG